MDGDREDSCRVPSRPITRRPKPSINCGILEVVPLIYIPSYLKGKSTRGWVTLPAFSSTTLHQGLWYLKVWFWVCSDIFRHISASLWPFLKIFRCNSIYIEISNQWKKPHVSIIFSLEMAAHQRLLSSINLSFFSLSDFFSPWKLSHEDSIINWTSQ